MIELSINSDRLSGEPKYRKKVARGLALLHFLIHIGIQVPLKFAGF
jgi:hypothetical protein